MNVTSLRIDKKKYRIMPEEEYLALMRDLADLKKVLKRRPEEGVEARVFFKNADLKFKPKK